MKNNDVFLTMSGIRESGKMFAVGDNTWVWECLQARFRYQTLYKV